MALQDFGRRLLAGSGRGGFGRRSLCGMAAGCGVVVMSAGLAFGQVLRADELIVLQGEVYTVSVEGRVIEVDRLIMQDGAVMELAEDVSRLEIRAQEATIGAGVTIRGRGAAGVGGEDGVTGAGAGPLCSQGHTGGRGGDGLVGANGRAVDIVMGVVDIGSLVIEVGGGPGGDGGMGGVGGVGSRGSCQVRLRPPCGCGGGRGGTGGAGGSAGSGGDGGSVSIQYWPLSDDARVEVIANVEGGEPGRLGQPGGGGSGGSPFRCTNGCAIFGTTKPGGSRGTRGAPGGEGGAGSRGSYGLQVVRPVALGDGRGGGR